MQDLYLYMFASFRTTFRYIGSKIKNVFLGSKSLVLLSSFSYILFCSFSFCFVYFHTFYVPFHKLCFCF